MARVYLFIDYWNFNLDWEAMVGRTKDGDWIRLDWKALPKIVLGEIAKRHGSAVDYSGTNVYTSVSPDNSDPGLRKFFNSMQSFEGYTVTVIERKSRKRPIRCNQCKTEIADCPNCKAPFRVSVEKGVDTALITEMIEMASDDVYDIAVLGSTDADLCQAVKLIQRRFGKKVYHLSFPDLGVSVKNACWSFLEMRTLSDQLKRPQRH